MLPVKFVKVGCMRKISVTVIHLAAISCKMWVFKTEILGDLKMLWLVTACSQQHYAGACHVPFPCICFCSHNRNRKKLSRLLQRWNQWRCCQMMTMMIQMTLFPWQRPIDRQRPNRSHRVPLFPLTVFPSRSTVFLIRRVKVLQRTIMRFIAGHSACYFRYFIIASLRVDVELAKLTVCTIRYLLYPFFV